MKQIFTIFIFIAILLNADKLCWAREKQQAKKQAFSLSHVRIGFGSNMFRMQPIFRVDNHNFIYTFEEVWISPKQKVIRKDTLLTGYFRQSSIDSISAIVDTMTQTKIYRDRHLMSGTQTNLEIITEKKTVNFTLWNASDPTAKKIFHILDSYISDSIKRVGSLRNDE